MAAATPCPPVTNEIRSGHDRLAGNLCLHPVLVAVVYYRSPSFIPARVAACRHHFHKCLDGMNHPAMDLECLPYDEGIARAVVACIAKIHPQQDDLALLI